MQIKLPETCGVRFLETRDVSMVQEELPRTVPAFAKPGECVQYRIHMRWGRSYLFSQEQVQPLLDVLEAVAKQSLSQLEAWKSEEV